MGNTYILNIYFQPELVNEDKTYWWTVFQVDGVDDLKLVVENNFLIIKLNESMNPGKYSIDISTDYGVVKQIQFYIDGKNYFILFFFFF